MPTPQTAGFPISSFRSFTYRRLALAALLAGSCGEPPATTSGQPDPPAEDTGARVELALTSVPAGVLCIRINVATPNNPTVSRLLPVAPGTASATLSVGQLPAGSATFDGDAFNLDCAAIMGSTPSWVADPAAADLRPGVLTRVAMTFRRNNAVTAVVNFLDNVAEVAVGFQATYARMGDGTVKQWGRNGGIDRLLPTTVAGLASVAEVAAGDDFACARRTDGSVLCWGRSSFGVLGPAVPVNAVSATPVAVPLPAAAIQVTAGSGFACALVSTGQISCWGGNFFGTLGNGTNTDSQTPVTVLRPTLVGPTVPLIASRVTAGLLSACAIDPSSLLFCWGQNGGIFGNGVATSTNIAPPNPPITNGLPPSNVPSGVVDASLGDGFSCMLRGDGLVACSGANQVGQLGRGQPVLNNTSLVFVSVLNDGLDIAVGRDHACARRGGTAGTVSCWGSGFFGEQGDGMGSSRIAPGPVLGLGAVKAVRAHASRHTCVELPDLTVRCWGSNEAGQLGDGTRMGRPTPSPVMLQ